MKEKFVRYELWWGSYFQGQLAAKTNEEAIAAARQVLPDDAKDWVVRLVYQLVVE